MSKKRIRHFDKAQCRHAHRRMSFLSVALSILLVSPLFATQVDSTWVGGSSGDWETASNWNPAIVPENGANTFVVTINGSTSEVKVRVSQNHTITQLDCYGKVELANEEWGLPSLTVLNGITNQGDLEIENLYIDANIVNTNDATVTFDEEHAHEDQFRGNLTNNAGGTIEVQDSLNFYYDGVLDNAGTINLNVDGKLYGGPVSELFNRGSLNLRGGICTNFRFLNDVNGIITGPGTIVAAGNVNDKFENTGTIYPNGAMTCISATDVNNQGKIEINVASSVTFSSNLINKSGATIKTQGGNLVAPTITQKAGATLEGDGKISGNLVIEPNARAAFTGPTEIYGDVQIDANAVLDINDGTTLIKGHCTCDNGTIHLKGGWLIPQGGLTNNNCNILWEPGLYNNIADFNLDGKVDFKDFASFADTWLWQTQW